MIVFASNFMNHHQLPLCLEIIHKYDGEFYFIATESIPEERISLGYEDLNSSYNFIIKSYESKENSDFVEKLVKEADVLILGSAPESYIKIRPKNKLIFRYTERPYRNYSKWKAFVSEIIHHFRYLNHPNIYLLCASAYTAIDHAQFGMYKNKMYKWGYFPEIKKYENIENIIEWKHSSSILWVARLIEWKHPEIPIKLAKCLKSAGYEFEINLIGNGYLEDYICTLIQEFDLEDCVHLLGSMTPKQVRKHMEQSQIFIFTSDRNEGWGAVLNEAMNSGCAVVASDAIGSVPFLINSGINGYWYSNGNFDDLFCKVKRLLDEPQFRNKMGYEAYNSILNEWSPQTASERLLNLIDYLQDNEMTPYEFGPCSVAEVIKEKKVNE